MTEQFARNEIDAEISFSPAENRSGSAVQAAVNDNRAADILLDQYYTRQDVADHFYDVFQEHYDPANFIMVEPSAGTGSFYKLLPPERLGYDVEPKYPGVATADFLTVELSCDRPVTIIGNPPFGKNASMAVRFFNHAARQSSVIALGSRLVQSQNAMTAAR